MGDFIPTTPPAGLLEYLVPVFFLITALFRNNVAFLVFCDGKIEWLMLDQIMIDAVRELQHQIPIDQIDWHRLCQHFFSQFQRLPFYLHQRIHEIDWNNVIFFRRTMQVHLEDGMLVYARYIENFGEMWCDQSEKNEHHIRCQIRGTDEEVVIPISAIVNHMPSRKDVDEYLKKLAQQQAEKEAARAAEEAERLEKKRIADIKKRSAVLPPTYPRLSDFFLQILFNLCMTKRVVIGFTLEFNLLFLEHLNFDEERQTGLSGISEENSPNFEIFKKKYNECFADKFIYPRPQPKYYPLLSEHLLQILYHLSVRCNIAIQLEYAFNLIVFRLLSFGDQTQFQLPQLSEEEREKYEVVKTKYNTEMCGNWISSKTTRSQEPSGIPENQKRLFEWYVFMHEFDDLTPEDVRVFLMRSEEINQRLAKNMESDVEALSLPNSYWTQPEHGVVAIQNLSIPMFHYLSVRRQ
jgi:hypothetical protein